jgi:lipoate synthase
MGIYEIKKRLEKRNIPCAEIEWFSKWSHAELKEFIRTWFDDTDQPVIALSLAFGLSDIKYILNVLRWAKQFYPNLKIIIGGNRTFDRSYQDLVDVVFIGRSMQTFEDWLDGKNIDDYILEREPTLILLNHVIDTKIDIPCIPKLRDEDFYCKNEILGFEIGIGCKFNCSFCNYDLRSMKNPKMIDSYDLRQLFEEAHGRFGIDHFYAADDTLNESEDKLHIISDVISKLKFQPKISCFLRLDLLKKKEQQEFYKHINFNSVFFGVESFNEKASRMIRKKGDLGYSMDILKDLRILTPDTWLAAGLIIGLTGDSEHSIKDSLETVNRHNLLDSVSIYPLQIGIPNSFSNQVGNIDFHDDNFYSDISKNPSKYGYEIIDQGKLKPVTWKNDWITETEANDLSRKLQYQYTALTKSINGFDYGGISALGLAQEVKKKNSANYVSIKHKSFAIANKLKKEYIQKKLHWVKNHCKKPFIHV